jgi:hypothetical protein
MVEQFQDPDDSPLLDIDSDIERSEKHWGEAPITCDGSEDEVSNQTLRDL